jgi:hypothetical protein
MRTQRAALAPKAKPFVLGIVLGLVLAGCEAEHVLGRKCLPYAPAAAAGGAAPPECAASDAAVVGNPGAFVDGGGCATADRPLGFNGRPLRDERVGMLAGCSDSGDAAGVTIPDDAGACDPQTGEGCFNPFFEAENDAAPAQPDLYQNGPCACLLPE